MKQHNRPLAALIASTAIACGSSHAYVPPPAVTTTSAVSSVRVARYDVPPEAPQGSLAVASYGITRISPVADPGEHLDAIHVRLTVENGSEQEWYVDTRRQRVILDERGTSAPSFASSSPGWPPPVVPIPPRDRRVVDLFFPLPFDLQRAHVVPQFDAVWQLQLPGRTTSARTPFERLRVEPAPIHGENDYGVNYYWGPPYWYDESPGFGFAGMVLVPREYQTAPLVIRREPNPPRFLPPSPARAEASLELGVTR